MLTMKGNKLCPEDQREVLASYVHRFTGNHKPSWAAKSDRDYKVQFKDDQDWLANTEFAVNKNGRLDKRSRHCNSNPTWPEGSEVRI